MVERRIKRGLVLLAVLCLMIPLSHALADEEDAWEMAVYWRIVGSEAEDTPLAQAMNGTPVPLESLKAVTSDELLAFAATYQLPLSMARYAYYNALADSLVAALDETGETQRILRLFLDVKNAPKDKDAKQERKSIRKSLTEEEIRTYAAETGLPAGFLAWLMLDDEWYEGDWEDIDDWREDYRTWQFADWVDEADLWEKYGREAFVTDDEVEWVLRQNGYRMDD